MKATDFDIIIAGAGPGGCACALSLAESGLSIGMLEKAKFPRDKICGDAMSPDVLNQMAKLTGNLREDFLANNASEKVDVTGVRIVSASGKVAELSIEDEGEKITGWVAKRIDFDNYMFAKASALPNVTAIEDCSVIDVEQRPDSVMCRTTKGEMCAAMVIGADGAHSVISKKLTDFKMKSAAYKRKLSRSLTTNDSPSSLSKKTRTE